MASPGLRAAIAVGVTLVVVAVAAALVAVLGSSGAGDGDGRSRAGGAASTPSASAGLGLAGIEQPTASPTPSKRLGLPGLSKHARQRLVVSPSLRAASVSGRVVAGYPLSVVPVPRKATVRSTSVTGPGRRMQATMVARWPGPLDSLVRYYGRALRSHGLAGSPAVRAGDSQAVVFSNGSDAVTLTTRGSRRGPINFSVVSVLRTSG